MASQSPLRFAAIGLNHGHIYGQTDILLEAGAQLVSTYAVEPELIAAYGEKYPQAARAASEEEILADPSIQLIINAGIPCERAPLGIRAMLAGKDYMTDKPGMTTFAQLEEVRRVHAETGRIYSVDFSERFHVRSAVKASELIREGAIGKVLQVVILAPHQSRFATLALPGTSSVRSTAASWWTSAPTSSTRFFSTQVLIGRRSSHPRPATCTTPSIRNSRISAMR